MLKESLLASFPLGDGGSYYRLSPSLVTLGGKKLNAGYREQ